MNPDPLYVETDEEPWTPPADAVARRRSGRIAAACLLGCALIVLVALGRNGS